MSATDDAPQLLHLAMLICHTCLLLLLT